MEALATRVPELTDDQRLQTYIHGLKLHIWEELELHNTSTMEKERRKAKIIENKFKRSTQGSFNKNYSKRNPPQSTNTGTSRYTPSHLREGEQPSLEAQRMREAKCKYCGEKWDLKHKFLQRSNPPKLYACEAEKEEKVSENEESSEQDTGN